MSEPIAILNGQIVPVSHAAISVFDTGFVHGAAVAEMIRTFNHRPFRVDDHLARMRRGIDLLRIGDAPKPALLKKSIDQLITHNAGLIPKHRDLGIIVFVTPGLNPTYTGLLANADGPRCTWGVHTFPLPFALWAAKIRTGQELVIPDVRQVPSDSLDPTVKWRSRVHWVVADQQVRRQNPAAAALLTDHNGYLTETSTANIFVVRDGRMRTPRKETTLDGISRRVVFELAAKSKIPCDFADITPDEAMTADEVFLSSTPYCLMPVAAISGKRIGDETPGPIYRELTEKWSRLVRLDIPEQIQTAAAERTA